MGMGGDPPPAPDYVGQANAQAAAGKELNVAQTWANRPELSTPWGSMGWNVRSATDPATGQPITQWRGDLQLSPEQQAALDSQQRIQAGRSQGAETLLSQAISAFQQQPDWSNLPARAESVTGLERSPESYRDTAQEAVWRRQQPALQERRAALETQLANQGLGRGTEAWNREMRGMADEEARARLSAIESGRAESAQQFGQDYQTGLFGLNAGAFSNQNRQQAIAEQQMQRSQILNELNSLLTGQQVATPQMPSFSPAGKSAAPDLLGASQAQYGAGLDAYNADQAGQAGMMGGLFSLGAASAPWWAPALMAMSDRRVKKNVRRIGTHRLGIGIYEFDYIWGEPSVGVMADELEKVMPEAVGEQNGYKVVNYAMI